MKNKSYIRRAPYLRNSIEYDHDFGTLVKNDDMFKVFFYFFKVLIFRVISGVKVQIIAQMTKNSAFRGPYLRDYASYDCHLWYKCVK